MNEREVRHKTTVEERRLKQDPTRVFQAWSNAEQRRRWHVPGDGWQIAEFHQEFRVGGSESFRFGPPGNPHLHSEGHFLDIVPDRHIISAGVMRDNGAAMSTTQVTVEFYPDATGTRLILTDQSAFFGAETVSDRESGWKEVLVKLEAVLNA
jgi:uncharacterized protein YndB with AHSA1/START domain